MAIRSVKVAADFETTVDPNDCRVWAACAVEIESGEVLHLGNSIEGFFEFLADKNTVCYFHNLKFDGEFIVSYLLEQGFERSDNREPRTFSTLISDMGQWYEITVVFEKKNKKYKKVVFRDSLKKLPFKVDTIAKAFELPLSKLEIDYNEYRPIGHELTEEEREYIIADCKIVAAALKIQIGKGLKKMTIGSDALNGFKEIIDKKQFEYLFPVLPLALDEDIRRAYKGGYVYLKAGYESRRGLSGITFDVNSLYPSVMYECLLPFGYPMYFEGEPEPDELFPIYVVRLECAFDLKPEHLPTIQLKHSRAFMPTEYLTSSRGEVVEMTLTSVDLALFLEHYHVEDLTYISGYKFRAKRGIFCEYIDYWMHIKETTTGAMRQLAKLMLNSLYGKFATNPVAGQKLPILDADGVVRYEYTNDDPRDPVYTAMGAFITAYAREKTIRSAQKVYGRFIYADTDSLHLIGHEIPEELDVHPTRLGAWKNEGTFVDSKFIRAKTYMETYIDRKPRGLKSYIKLLVDDKIETIVHEGDEMVYTSTKVTCAGMPDNVKKKVTYSNFCTGSSFSGKLVPMRCKGGVVLVDRTFTLK